MNTVTETCTVAPDLDPFPSHPARVRQVSRFSGPGIPPPREAWDFAGVEEAPTGVRWVLCTKFFHHKHPVCAITDSHPAPCENVLLDGAVKRCARFPKRPSKLPQTHFQRSLTS
jgi:hypothetical protein